jgi:hypothetical protein
MGFNNTTFSSTYLEQLYVRLTRIYRLQHVYELPVKYGLRWTDMDQNEIPPITVTAKTRRLNQIKASSLL